MGWKRTALELATQSWAACAPRAAAAPVNPRAIFVLRNNGIGDVLLVTPLLAALRRRFRRARIVVGVGSWARDVLSGNPDVDVVLPINAPWGNHLVQPQSLGALLRYLRSDEARRLAEERCDLGIDVLGSSRGSLLLLRARIPWRLGVRGYAGGHSAAQQCIDYREGEHVAVAALRFATLLGVTEIPDPRPRVFGAPAPHGGIVFAPGAGYLAKCWPLANYLALARMLAPRPILVIGDETDRPLGAALRVAGPHVDDRTGKLRLRETLAAIGGASLVVGNSSMAMHAAAAFQKPCLTLLGTEFPSASAHARQWGHPETRVLGREPERDHIASPEDVFDIAKSEGLLVP
jgi:heptosyltransferase-2